MEEKQANKYIMCSQYSQIQSINAKPQGKAPNPGEKRYARLNERKDPK